MHATLRSTALCCIVLLGAPPHACKRAIGAAATQEAPQDLQMTVLTTKGKLFEGRLDGFANGFLVLRQEDRILEISPAHIRALFANRADAEKALEKDAWLDAKFQPPAKEPAERPRPPEEPVLRPPERPADPKPSDPAPEDPEKKPKATLPSDLEREYFAKQPPSGVWRQEHFFDQCLKDAMQVARDYRENRREALRERAHAVAARAMDAAKNPKTMLTPDLYKPVLLAMAFSHEAVHLLKDALDRAEDEQKKNELQNKLKSAHKAPGVFVFLHRKQIQDSDLSEADKRTASLRLRKLFQAIGGGGRRRPGAPRTRPGLRERPNRP